MLRNRKSCKGVPRGPQIYELCNSIKLWWFRADWHYWQSIIAFGWHGATLSTATYVQVVSFLHTMFLWHNFLVCSAPSWRDYCLQSRTGPSHSLCLSSVLRPLCFLGRCSFPCCRQEACLWKHIPSHSAFVSQPGADKAHAPSHQMWRCSTYCASAANYS